MANEQNVYEQFNKRVIKGLEYLVAYRSEKIEEGTWRNFNNEEVRNKLDELGCSFKNEDLDVSKPYLMDLSRTLGLVGSDTYKYAAYVIARVYDDDWIELLSGERVKASYFFENDPVYSVYNFLHNATGKAYWPPELMKRGVGDLSLDFITGSESSYNSEFGSYQGKIRNALLNTRNYIMESFNRNKKL